MIEIQSSTPARDAERDLFVRSRPSGQFFQLAGWRRAVQRVFGHEPCDLLAFDDGRLVGVLPLMRSPGFVGGVSLISVPFGVYGGPLGETPEVERALVEHAQRLAERERVRRLELRCIDDPGLELARSELYATFVQDLPDSPEKVLPSLPKKARAEARKAREKHGLSLSEGAWYLADLDRLFQDNKRHLGSPGLPREWFETLLGEFGEACVVHAVHQQSRPLMAVMSFVWRDTLMTYYAGTADGADREFSASNFAYMALREWAVKRGLSRFDFGRSRKDAGAFAFKEHQGFVPRDLNYRYHLVRSKALPSFTPSNPATRLPREVWSRLPRWLCVGLSGQLARYLP